MMNIDWNKVNGLIPAVIQDAQSKDVLMLGYMNSEALDKTLESKKVTFYSRTKQRLWTKGETSGNFLNVESIELDCDGDTLLLKVLPMGPTCHKGTKTCFGEPEVDGSFLKELETIIGRRFEDRPEGSYISSLISKGLHKMAQKVGEEGVEVALAAKDEDQGAFLNESADLIFHLMVLLRARNNTLSEVASILAERHRDRSPPGH